jgi:hypothetical protein
MERVYQVFFPHQVKKYLHRYELNRQGDIADEAILWTRDRDCDKCLASGSVTCFVLDPIKARCDDCFVHQVEDLVFDLNRKYRDELTDPIVYWIHVRHDRYRWVRPDQGISILSNLNLGMDDLKDVKVIPSFKPIVEPFTHVIGWL